jgi:hypothetical protein
MRTLYDVLQVREDASAEVVKAAYKALAQRYHPDRNPNDSDAAHRMTEINRAYATLSDAAARKAYDHRLAQQRDAMKEGDRSTTSSSSSDAAGRGSRPSPPPPPRPPAEPAKSADGADPAGGRSSAGGQSGWPPALKAVVSTLALLLALGAIEAMVRGSSRTSLSAHLAQTAPQIPEQPGVETTVASADIWERLRSGFGLPIVRSESIEIARRELDLTSLFRNSGENLSAVLARVEAEGLPSEIALLPALRTGFDPDFESRYGEVGLWRLDERTRDAFSSGAAGGIDPRRDRDEATGIALRALQRYEGNAIGSPMMAIAAFSCGREIVEKTQAGLEMAPGQTEESALIDGLTEAGCDEVAKLFALRDSIRDAVDYDRRDALPVVMLRTEVATTQRSRSSSTDPTPSRPLSEVSPAATIDVWPDDPTQKIGQLRTVLARPPLTHLPKQQVARCQAITRQAYPGAEVSADAVPKFLVLCLATATFVSLSNANAAEEIAMARALNEAQDAVRRETGFDRGPAAERCVQRAARMDKRVVDDVLLEIASCFRELLYVSLILENSELVDRFPAEERRQYGREGAEIARPLDEARQSAN